MTGLDDNRTATPKKLVIGLILAEDSPPTITEESLQHFTIKRNETKEQKTKNEVFCKLHAPYILVELSLAQVRLFFLKACSENFAVSWRMPSKIVVARFTPKDQGARDVVGEAYME
jgi:hypothetical protein